MTGTLAMLIPILALSIPIIALWTKHQQKLAEMQLGATAEQTAEKAAQYVSQIQRLEDRVQVLERIVTDRGYDIATQIEALRDQRRVDEQGAGVPLGTLGKERV
ncbi:MAG: hypothetical protein ABS48_00740 [Erythrobacter sp. SCN 68-10]|nr:MAG: hypothetical protein ABS48_00740 [Erythrobacter sp. SCN 68-10]